VSKNWKPGKKTVELQPEARPSRIRRDPVPADKAAGDGKLTWESSEREIWLAMLGVLLFAVAIDIIVVAISAYWS
jgi:hypothetical protein